MGDGGERILELLAALRPALLYAGWTPEQLSAALRADGVAPGQLWIDGANRKGYRLEDVTSAVERRQLASSGAREA